MTLPPFFFNTQAFISPYCLSLLLCCVLLFYMCAAIRVNCLPFPAMLLMDFTINFHARVFIGSIFISILLFFYAIVITFVDASALTLQQVIDFYVLQQFMLNDEIISTLSLSNYQLKEALINALEGVDDKVKSDSRLLFLALCEDNIKKLLESDLELAEKTDPFFSELRKCFKRPDEAPFYVREEAFYALEKAKEENLVEERPSDPSSKPTLLSSPLEKESGKQNPDPKSSSLWGKIYGAFGLERKKNIIIDHQLSAIIQEIKDSKETPALDFAAKIVSGHLPRGEDGERIKGLSKSIPYGKISKTIGELPREPRPGLETFPYFRETAKIEQDALPYLEEVSINKKVGETIRFVCIKPTSAYEDVKLFKEVCNIPVSPVQDLAGHYAPVIRLGKDPFQCFFIDDFKERAKSNDLEKLGHKEIISAVSSRLDSIDFDSTPSTPRSPTTRYFQIPGAD